MSAKTIDVLIFIPLIPAFASFSLVSGWISKIPAKILGPYLLYCAFAIWYFEHSPWFVSMLALMGFGVSGVAIYDARKIKRSKQAREQMVRLMKEARDWPVAEGLFLYTVPSGDSDGIFKLTLHYRYKVHDEEFDGSALFTFGSRDDVERFESRCRERKLKIHYQEDKPEVCVLDRESILSPKSELVS